MKMPRLSLILMLPFLHTYRSMCFAPKPELRRVLEELRLSPASADLA